MTGDELFNRDEVLHGSVSRVRRARALVYLIEAEAARTADKNAVLTLATPMDGGITLAMLSSSDEELMRRQLPGEADEAFVESFRNARRPSSDPAVRTLERTTHAWKVLVPTDVPLRCEVLHQLSLRHELPRNKTRSIAKAFGTDADGFADTYRQTVGESVDTVFGPDAGVLAKLKSRFARR